MYMSVHSVYLSILHTTPILKKIYLLKKNVVMVAPYKDGINLNMIDEKQTPSLYASPLSSFHKLS